MAKLFLFAIGGTGSRVVKALTMLLASGVEINNTEQIIPIVIDPDSSNGDLTRTVDILKEYKIIREKSFSTTSNYFKTKISSLDELGDNSGISDKFTFDIDGVKSSLFKEFIGFNELDESNKALTSLLFSKLNLDADMEVGFKGNPNIGSVVLNKFKESEFFIKFASNFEKEDRIFIISSIFGGTGAAGFPLILKNIRDAKDPIPHFAFLNESKIGAVSVLPYFGVDKSSGSSIDSNTFVSKTIAALKYYADNICKNNSINALYYIGDNLSNDQKGADGAGGQKNNAHFVEMAAALSIIDFMSIPDDELTFSNKQVTNPKYFEFGIKNDINTITFDDLAPQTFDQISRPIASFSLFLTYMMHHYLEVCQNSRMVHIYDGINKLDKENLDPRFRQHLNSFFNFFVEWINEMSISTISFAPLNLNNIGDNIFNQINGRVIGVGYLDRILNGKAKEQYIGMLNAASSKFDHLSSCSKLLALHHNVTHEILTEKIKLS
jgi:hypothetical protein